MNNIEFVRSNIIAKEVVLIDGAPRSAKSLLGQIIGSFHRVEIERMEPFIESIPILFHYNKISQDAATVLLKREVDIKLYDSMISRNTNFRFADRTSIFKDTNTFKYLKRLFKNEGKDVLNRIHQKKPIFQLMTHDMLQKSDIFFNIYGSGLKIIEMVRHPIDLVVSMNEHGYGSSIGENPLLWELAIKSSKQDIPYYAIKWIDEFLEISPFERIIKIISNLTIEVNDKYRSLPKRKQNQILFIPYEKFVTTPNGYIAQLSEFLGTRTTRRTKNAMSKQRIPRSINILNRSKKYDLILKKASKPYVKLLDCLIKDYEKEDLNN